MIALFLVKYFWLENEWEFLTTRISAPPKVTKYYKVFHRSARGEPDFGKQMLILVNLGKILGLSKFHDFRCQKGDFGTQKA